MTSPSKVSWKPGIESPLPSQPSHTARPTVPKPPPSPSLTVQACLLATSEEHAKGLQRTNDRLQEDLVAAEMRAEAADRQRLDFEERWREEVNAREQLQQQLDKLTGKSRRDSAASSTCSLASSSGSSLKRGLRRSDILKMNQQNAAVMAEAMQASIKQIADTQLEYLKALIDHSDLIVDFDDDGDDELLLQDNPSLQT